MPPWMWEGVVLGVRSEGILGAPVEDVSWCVDVSLSVAWARTRSQPAPGSPHCIVLPVITADKLLQLRAAVPGRLPAVRPQAAPWESIHFNKRYTLCY